MMATLFERQALFGSWKRHWRYGLCNWTEKGIYMYILKRAHVNYLYDIAKSWLGV